MTEQSANQPDLVLNNGQWEPSDLLAGCPDGADVGDFLRSQGWTEFLAVGDCDGSLGLRSWQRHSETSQPEYLLEVASVAAASPYLLVKNFAELMDLFARWAPAVQAAAISDVVEDLWSNGVVSTGAIEQVAARVAYGAREGLEQLVRDKREHHRWKRTSQ